MLAVYNIKFRLVPVCPKIGGVRGSAPNPAGGAQDAPPDPLAKFAFNTHFLLFLTQITPLPIRNS